MARVMVTRRLPAPGIDPLVAANLDVDHHDSDDPLDPSELRARVVTADGLLCLLTDRIDAPLLDAAPRLRIVANLAVGHDNIDVDAATERGVVVTNTPDVLTDETADLAWALILAASRRVVEGDSLVRTGRWVGWRPTQLLGHRVHGRTLGILGMGRIGQAVARRARGFDMTVRYHNRQRDEAAEHEFGAVWCELDELLATADVLSIHVPATTETHHLLDGDRLAAMKPGAILVNTARGTVVDELALVDALRSGHLGAAGLDVYEREPELAVGLAGLANVVLLPHLGSSTVETRGAMVELCCANVAAVLSGEPPLTPVT